MQLISFYTPRKHQKTSAFLMFPGDTKETNDMKWVSREKTFQAGVSQDIKITEISGLLTEQK